jgi:hypothetical protein
VTDAIEPSAEGAQDAPAPGSSGVAVVTGVAGPGVSGLGGLSLVRVEDVLLAAWIAVAAPLIARAGSLRPFETGRPVEGVLILAGVVAALVCLVTRTSDGTARRPAVGGSIGPLTGGLLLVTFAGFSALDAPSSMAMPIAVAGIALVALVRLRVPSLPSAARRALVMPFVLISGSLFWGFIDAVIGPGGASGVTASQLRDALLGGTAGAGTVGLALLAFSAVYYAMLVYAPRQIADGDGGAVAWLARFALFVASVLLGWGWVNAIGF